MKQVFSYFAYGSNMCTNRLRERTPSARSVGVGSVRGHQLRWHKKSYDGSGKCDLFFTADDNHLVHGVLFEISVSEKKRLDTVEGLHQGYDEKMVEVVTASGVIPAVTYFATVIDKFRRPYEWYKRFVVEGAIEHGLSEQYVQELQAIESIEDPDIDRVLRETRIFEGRIIT